MRTSNAYNDRHGSLGDVTFTRFSRALLLTDTIQSSLFSLSLSLSFCLLFSLLHSYTYTFHLSWRTRYTSHCVPIKRNSRVYMSFWRSWKLVVVFPFSLSFLPPSVRLIAPTPFPSFVLALSTRLVSYTFIHV